MWLTGRDIGMLTGKGLPAEVRRRSADGAPIAVSYGPIENGHAPGSVPNELVAWGEEFVDAIAND